MGKMMVTEFYGSPETSVKLNYKLDERSFKLVQTTKTGQGNFSLWNRIRMWFTVIFLPQGFPESVSNDYVEYQVWDTIQAFCSSITRTMATYAVLKGSGVGDATATAMGATLIWLWKDGFGMLGRIMFAYSYGSALDCNAKQWRFFADVLNDCAILVEMMAPLAPKQYYIYIMCLTGVAYSIVGVAGGCTRAALTQHQARRNNMADVSAKDGSQETIVNLLGMAASLLLTPLCSRHPHLPWLLYAVFTCGHLIANYLAVRCVVIDTFNRRRLATVLARYCTQAVSGGSAKVMTPAQANALEPIFFSSGSGTDWMRLGCSIGDSDLKEVDAKRLLEGGAKYIVTCDKLTRKCDVALSHEADSLDVVGAAFHAYLLSSCYSSHNLGKLRAFSRAFYVAAFDFSNSLNIL